MIKYNKIARKKRNDIFDLGVLESPNKLTSPIWNSEPTKMKNIRNVSNNLFYRVQKTENKPDFHYTKKKKQMFIIICLPRAPNDLVYQTIYIQLIHFMFHMHLNLTYLYLQKMHLETLILTMHSAINLFMGIDTRLLIILHPWCLNCMQVYKIDPFFLSFSQTTFLCCSGICMLFVDDTIGGTTMKCCWVNKHDAISSILCSKRQFCHQKKNQGTIWWEVHVVMGPSGFYFLCYTSFYRLCNL